MAEAVLLALSKISTTLGDEATKAVMSKLSAKVTHLKGAPGKVEEIRVQLVRMNNVIRRIDTAYLTNEVLKSWIAEVRKIAYHVEDVMDKYLYYSLQMKEEGFPWNHFKGSHYVMVFREIVDEIDQIEKEIKQVIKLKVELLDPSCLVPDQFDDIERQPRQYCIPEHFKDEHLVGIEDGSKMLVEWLYSDEPESTVIAVWGMGGLGKTTLVANVYKQEKNNFPAHSWISVSQGYTMVALLRQLLQDMGHSELALVDQMDEYVLREEVARRLKDTKCLIVLDDIWDREACIQVQNAFESVQGTRIILTTRLESVAVMASTQRCLQLAPLNGINAFELFCKRVFYNRKNQQCPRELKKLACDMVDRCHGLPLAIVSIGGLMSSVPPIENAWQKIYYQLQAELANNNNVQAILSLSYHHLPGDLKNCFLYCSLFPEVFPIPQESLVRLWVAEGFVVSNEQNTPEEVAEGNLMELIHRNMLEVVETDELGKVSTCRMHDIMRDLAISVAKEERFGSAGDYSTMLMINNNIRRLSTCRWRDNRISKVRFPCLRTLISWGTISSSPRMLLSILSDSSYLTVFDLQDSDITEVPASIGNLFNVRYIGLRRTKVKSLPETIGKLYNLHTLDIKQTKIEELPRGIVKAKKLRCVLADRFANENQSEFRYFIGVQAPKGLCNLQELQTLETVQAREDLAEQLVKLIKLRSVSIDNISSAHCTKLFATLSKIPLLSTLLLSARDPNETLYFETLKPTSMNLHRLIVRGCWATGSLQCPIFQDHGRYLNYLALSWCNLVEDPLEVLAPHVPNLTYLSLDMVSSPNTLVLPSGSFPHLKMLILKRMPDVTQLKIMGGALPCIEGLYIVSLKSLERIPQGIESLRSLKKLWLLDLYKDFKVQWDADVMNQKMQDFLDLRI